VFGNLYGTGKQTVAEKLKAGVDVVLEIDWQGAQQIRRQAPEAVSIFILPPSREILEQRLIGRGQDPVEVIRKRMSQATEEISHHVEFDYLIINDDFDKALREMQAVVLAQRLRITRQCERHSTLIQSLLK